jgi:hypothetical protein
MNASARAPDEIITTFAWDERLEALYASWRRRAETAERIHAEAAGRLRRRRTMLAALTVAAIVLLGAVALAPVVAPQAYASATAGIDRDVVSIVEASLAAVAAVLVVVQAAAHLGARAEDHRIAAVRYASLARAMALTAAMPRDVRGAPDDALTYVRLRLDRYTRESPHLGLRRRARLDRAFEPSADGSSATLVLDAGASAERFVAS